VLRAVPLIGQKADEPEIVLFLRRELRDLRALLRGQQGQRFAREQAAINRFDRVRVLQTGDE
jgi:hypothetical protein